MVRFSFFGRAFSMFSQFLLSVVSLFEHIAIPSPRDVLALDALRRSASIEADGKPSFTAFIARALRHPNYSAGHFDPGRTYA